MPQQSNNGVVTLPSSHGVNETVSRLEQLLASKGIKVFAVVDHSGEAERAGLQMPNTKLVIFGNPKAGTALMLAAPTIAIDLPLKILIWERADGTTWISYNSPEFIACRHGLPVDLMSTLAAVVGFSGQIAN